MPNEELKTQNVETVLRVTYNLFLEYGIEKVTWEMMSRESGLSRRTIERYFANKADCVMKVIEKAWREITAQIQSKYPVQVFESGEYKGTELLRLYMEDIKNIFFTEPRHFILCDEFKVFVYRNCDDFEQGYKMLWNWLNNRSMREAIYALGRRDGSMRPNVDLYTEEEYFCDDYLCFLANLAISLNANWRDDAESKVDKRIDNTIELYSHGIVDFRK